MRISDRQGSKPLKKGYTVIKNRKRKCKERNTAGIIQYTTIKWHYCTWLTYEFLKMEMILFIYKVMTETFTMGLNFMSEKILSEGTLVVQGHLVLYSKHRHCVFLPPLICLVGTDIDVWYNPCI
jgi:hypothetical protein